MLTMRGGLNGVLALLLVSGVAGAQTPTAPKETANIAALRKDAEQGHARDQWSLGYAYDVGQGVPKDDAQAVAWFRKAAEQGHALGQSNLGTMYRDGQGVPQDSTQAVAWYRKAAEQGFAPAQFSLGVMYHLGRGVPKDVVSAHFYCNLAASRATGDAQKKFAESRDNIAAKMTPQQLADAQRLAREWQAAFEQRQKKTP